MHLRTLIRFDVLVNGGGAVTLQFQRSPFQPLTRTVFVPWNQIVVLPPVVMILSKEGESYKSNQPPSPAVGKHPSLGYVLRIFFSFFALFLFFLFIFLFFFFLVGRPGTHISHRVTCRIALPINVTNVSINARTCSIT